MICVVHCMYVESTYSSVEDVSRVRSRKAVCFAFCSVLFCSVLCCAVQYVRIVAWGNSAAVKHGDDEYIMVMAMV